MLWYLFLICSRREYAVVIIFHELKCITTFIAMLLDFLKGYYDIIIILIQSVTKLTDIVKQTSKYVEGNGLKNS